MGISRGRWRSGLGGNLGASDQNDIAVENGLCNAEEAGHDLRIVVGVHGGLIDEPLMSGEDAGVGLVLRNEEADRVGLVAADVFGDLQQGAAHGVFVPLFGADDGGDGQHGRALSMMNFRKTDLDAVTDRRSGIMELPGGSSC
jgi:hypothetical protein